MIHTVWPYLLFSGVFALFHKKSSYNFNEHLSRNIGPQRDKGFRHTDADNTTVGFLL